MFPIENQQSKDLTITYIGIIFANVFVPLWEYWHLINS